MDRRTAGYSVTTLALLASKSYANKLSSAASIHSLLATPSYLALPIMMVGKRKGLKRFIGSLRICCGKQTYSHSACLGAEYESILQSERFIQRLLDYLSPNHSTLNKSRRLSR